MLVSNFEARALKAHLLHVDTAQLELRGRGHIFFAGLHVNWLLI